MEEKKRRRNKEKKRKGITEGWETLKKKNEVAMRDRAKRMEGEDAEMKKGKEKVVT